MRVGVVIPAYNEAECLGLVLEALPSALVDTVVMVDNASTDGTAQVARGAGARVVREERRGYGSPAPPAWPLWGRWTWWCSSTPLWSCPPWSLRWHWRSTSAPARRRC